MAISRGFCGPVSGQLFQIPSIPRVPIPIRLESVIYSFRQDVSLLWGAGHLHHENAFDLGLRFACEIFRKSSGAFWPKHNLISTRSNHTRETLTATPAKDAAPFIVSQLTQDIELS
jgi:hypothetical protein